MAILFGVHFNDKKLVSRALTSFYGIGPIIAQRLMAKFSIYKLAKVGNLNDKQVTTLAEELSGMTIENDLRRQLVQNIQRLRDMSSYRGRRHAMGLPVRGQRTRSQIVTARKLNQVERRG
ncbi:ribosomal protein S13 [Dissoconium aciculare CBS 342.82]|uniref:Ribosomal protein S13 n=1 Tax=Dissoconium aciculare CBS 342.82 TaxID=1314786 RepID=A0A6J3M7F6_9PEZI|nr:ribosomal protein S13 [Dissoconium aciculare CBS 342.82]KAF1823996.1 ribosomal protein S13 [Dissoconium aciculare CBS 342.82]